MFRLSTGLIIILCIAIIVTIYAYLLPADYNAIKAKEVGISERERIRLYSIRCLHSFVFLFAYLYPFLIESVLVYDILFVIIMLCFVYSWFVYNGCILSNIENKILDKNSVRVKLNWKKIENIHIHYPFLLVLFPDEKYDKLFDVLFYYGFIPGFYVVYRIWTKRGELFTEDSVEA